MSYRGDSWAFIDLEMANRCVRAMTKAPHPKFLGDGSRMPNALSIKCREGLELGPYAVNKPQDRPVRMRPSGSHSESKGLDVM